MPDYKELYLKQFRAAEKAINILIEAQQECEQRFIEESEMEAELKQLLQKENEKGQLE